MLNYSLYFILAYVEGVLHLKVHGHMLCNRKRLDNPFF